MPDPSSPAVSPILDDRPADRDALDFTPYRDIFVDILRDPDTRTPLTVGLFGSWGSGKTSLITMIKSQIDAATLPAFRTTWFNAWKYNREDALWRALILHVLDALRPASFGPDGALLPDDQLDAAQKALAADLDRLEDSLYRTVEWEEVGRWTLDWVKALRGTAEGAADIALSFVPGGRPLIDLLRQAAKAVTGQDKQTLADAFRREVTAHRREQIRSLEQFERQFQELLERHVVSQGGRLIVFVDDLDRCLPEKAIDVLEAIKLFLDVPGCIFVLGLDQDAIVDAIQARYGGPGKAQQYLEKIIQIPFMLPKIETARMRDFIKSLVPTLPDPRCGDVFAEGLPPRPRQVKRTVNIFLLLWRLSQHKAEAIRPVRLAKIVTIQHAYPALYALLGEVPGLLRDLEVYFRAEEKRVSDKSVELPPLSPQLQSFTGQIALRRILTMHAEAEPHANFADLTPIDIAPYIYLTYRATPRPETPVQLAEVVEPLTIAIPAGAVMIGSHEPDAFDVEKPAHEVVLPAYAIGRYPVTNYEYRAFVRDTKHAPPDDWEGGSYAEGLGDHPVVYVSWRDTRAYCEWLSQKTGKAYRLPTEAEWEKAARGTDGRIWPWGNTWDVSRCNSIESGLRHTTPVGQYAPHGNSPHGIADMAGNVSEWCSSLQSQYPYQADDGREDTNVSGARVVRGGSFLDEPREVRCAYRLGRLPNSRERTIGFRVALS